MVPRDPHSGFGAKRCSWSVPDELISVKDGSLRGLSDNATTLVFELDEERFFSDGAVVVLKLLETKALDKQLGVTGGGAHLRVH